MSQASAMLEGLSHEALWRLEEVCNRFEQQWLSGERPSLNAFVGETQGIERLATLGELLRLDVHYRRLAGENPSREDYAAWLPHGTSALYEVLPDEAATLAESELPSDADPNRTTDPSQDGVSGRNLFPPPRMPAVDEPLAPDLPASRFRVLRFHAAGGLGEVFVAEDEELHREVALKEIQRRFVRHEDNRQRFVLEAEITGNLEHPGIVPVYGLGTYPDGRPFYAMRFIQGDTLEEVIRRFHRHNPGQFDSLEFRQLLGRLIAVCQAVAYAHNRGVLHRDLKPGNIMVGKFGETLVVDWGLAKVLGQLEPADGPPGEHPLLHPRAARAAETVGVVGTPAFMSPEQALGLGTDLGPATDVYSLGATLYATLTGKAPFQGNAADVIANVKPGRWIAPRQVDANVPEGLDAICRKAMSLRPQDRYTSAQALAEDLEHWLGDEPVAAAPDPLPARLRRWMRKHPRSVTAGVAFLVMMVLGLTAGTIVLQHRKREAEANFRMTREAALTFLVKVNEEELVNEPGMRILRHHLLEKALTFYQQFLEKLPNDVVVRGEMAGVTRQMGEVFLEEGKKPAATHHIRQALVEYEDLVAKRPVDPELRVGLAQTLLASTNLSLSTGKTEAAEEDANRALEELERLRATTPDAPKLLELHGRALDARATARSHLGKLDQAIEDNARSGRLMSHAILVLFTEYQGQHMWVRHRNMSEPRGEFGASFALFRAWLNQGNYQRLAGRPAEALASLGTAEFMTDHLQEKYRYLQLYNPRSARMRLGLAAVRLQVGWAALDLGLPGKALPAIESALDLARGAVEDVPDEANAEPRRLLALGTGLAGEAHLWRGQPARAAELLTEAEARTRELAAEDQSGNLLAARTHFLALLARLEAGRGRPAAGSKLCEQALAAQERALQARPWDRGLRADSIRTRRVMARLRHQTVRDDRTLHSTLEGLLEETRALAARPPAEPTFQREVSAAAADLAAALVETGKPADAVRILDDVAASHERLITQDDNWIRLQRFQPAPGDQDPLRNNPRAVVYQIDRIGLMKDFWARSPARQPEDLHSRRIWCDLLAIKARAQARLGQAGPAERLALQAVATAERLPDGPSSGPVLPGAAPAAWGILAATVARREPCYLYDLACHQTLVATLRKEPADRAMATLRAMVASGLGEAGMLRADPRLEALQGRPDFLTLLETMESRKRPVR